jgi:uncharacterized RDD family membrane protein YckC
MTSALPPPPGAAPSPGTPPTPPMPAPPGWLAHPPSGADLRWYSSLASPWRRLGAYLIDGLVLSPLWIIGVVAFVLPRLASDPFWQRLDSSRPPTPAETEELTRQLQTRLFVPLLLTGICVAVISGVYNVTLTRWRGQTVGKMAVGIVVVEIADGSLPSWGNAISRWALPAVAALVPWVGTLGVLLIYLWILWDPNKQGLHDKVAKTVVIHKERRV